MTVYKHYDSSHNALIARQSQNHDKSMRDLFVYFTSKHQHARHSRLRASTVRQRVRACGARKLASSGSRPICRTRRRLPRTDGYSLGLRATSGECLTKYRRLDCGAAFMLCCCRFYCTARGIQIACRPSVCLSVSLG